MNKQATRLADHSAVRRAQTLRRLQAGQARCTEIRRNDRKHLAVASVVMTAAIVASQVLAGGIT